MPSLFGFVADRDLPPWCHVSAHVQHRETGAIGVIQGITDERISVYIVCVGRAEVIVADEGWEIEDFVRTWQGYFPRRATSVDQLYPGTLIHVPVRQGDDSIVPASPTDRAEVVHSLRQPLPSAPVEAVVGLPGSGVTVNLTLADLLMAEIVAETNVPPDERFPLGTILEDSIGYRLRVCEIGEDYIVTADDPGQLTLPCIRIERTFDIHAEIEIDEEFYITFPEGYQVPPEEEPREPPRSRFERDLELDDDTG